MKRTHSIQRVTCLMAAALISFLAIAPELQGDTLGYVQTNLVSNTSAIPAKHHDPNLVDPWGIASFPGQPFWVADQGNFVPGAAKSTLYDGSGNIIPLVVSITGSSLGPTGIVANSTSSFGIPGGPATFIFSTLDGTIAGWNPSTGMATVTAATVRGAIFTGLAEASVGSANYLYAANFVFGSGGIKVFDTNFKPVTLSGSFTDPHLPSGYFPYNIQAIGSQLYVEYAKLTATSPFPVPGAGLGIVDVFNTNGTFVKTLVKSGGALNVPWGIALAPPSGFGQFSGDLLVGNLTTGWIDAFDPTTGAFLGTLDTPQGTPVDNQYGLWGLEFGTGGKYGGNRDTLYFTTGPNFYADGIFGAISPSPEPATLTLLGSGLISLFGLRLRKKH